MKTTISALLYFVLFTFISCKNEAAKRSTLLGIQLGITNDEYVSITDSLIKIGKIKKYDPFSSFRDLSYDFQLDNNQSVSSVIRAYFDGNILYELQVDLVSKSFSGNSRLILTSQVESVIQLYIKKYGQPKIIKKTLYWQGEAKDYDVLTWNKGDYSITIQPGYIRESFETNEGIYSLHHEFPVNQNAWIMYELDDNILDNIKAKIPNKSLNDI